MTTFVNLLSQALLFQILYCHFVTMAEPEIFQQCHQHLVLYHILCFYPKSKQFVRNIQYKSENSINNVLQHILEHSLFDVMSHIICILASRFLNIRFKRKHGQNLAKSFVIKSLRLEILTPL